jgi:hypothetical protein
VGNIKHQIPDTREAPNFKFQKRWGLVILSGALLGEVEPVAASMRLLLFEDTNRYRCESRARGFEGDERAIKALGLHRLVLARKRWDARDKGGLVKATFRAKDDWPS